MACTNWNADFTSSSFTHFADNTIGTPSNISDDNTGTYVQNFTYCAIDMGSSNEKFAVRMRLHLLNSPAKTNFIGATFQGSNNSTDGTDGSWTTFVTFDSSNLGTPSYPDWGNYIEFTNNTLYRWYRINGTPANNNTLATEWEIFECSFIGEFTGDVIEQGNPIERTIYLHRRDTGVLMNTTTSSGGSYTLTTTHSGAHYIVCLDDDAGESFNDLILGNMIPTTVSG